jgi:tetratricopeptide (TPR) repeat protein
MKLRQILTHNAIFGFWGLLIASCMVSCAMIPSSSSPRYADLTEQDAPISRASATIYLQSFSGPNLKEVQEIFFETVREQRRFRFLELLPNTVDDISVLRLEVRDYLIWENEELVPSYEENVLSLEESVDIVLRRNAIVSIRARLFHAETGKTILDTTISQPFQQIYVGDTAIATRPPRELELQRLTKMVIFRMLSAFENGDGATEDWSRLEIGQGQGWISTTLFNLGNRRIKKGNRLAEAGDLRQAMLIWRLVLYQPSSDEPMPMLRTNRASAYFNLGLAFRHQREWEQAAAMFSKANRMVQKLTYAQSWGEAMQKWLEEQKQSTTTVDMQKQTESKPQFEIRAPADVSYPDLIDNLEQNDHLLLNAGQLWPLEPAVRYLSPTVSEPVDAAPTKP